MQALYERIGCEVIEQTPESHDRVMAHTHALTFFVAKGMIDAGAGMEVPFAPPSFQAMSRTIETVRSDAGHLFAAIARDNPFAAEARKQLVQALAAIDRALDDAGARGGRRTTRAGARTRRASRSPTSGSARRSCKQAREHIDAVDREIVRLLAQREAALAARGAGEGEARRAGARRHARGRAHRAGARGRGGKLDPDAVADVFRAIMTMSRRAQR